MSIVSVEFHPESGTGTRELEEATHELKYIVRTNSRYDEAKVVFEDPRLPKLGNSYVLGPNNESLVYCNHLSCDFADVTPSGRLFIVTARFTSKLTPKELENLQTGGGGVTIVNPLTLPPKVTHGGSTEQSFITTKDRNGDPIVNTVGEPFIDRPAIPKGFYEITITRNEFPLAPGLYLNLAYHVNATSWRGSLARYWLCTSIRHGELMVDGPFSYFEVSYSFAYNRSSWDVEILNAGLNFNKGGSRKPILDLFGNPVTTPVPIIESGTAAMALGGTPHYRTFRLYPEVEFPTELGIF